MAKKSKIARNEQRKVIVERYAVKRLELKRALVDPASTVEQKEAARVGLQKLPRDASPVRVRSRDLIDVVHVECYPSLVLAVFVSVTWHTRVSFQVSPSQAGKYFL